ncbi:MAG: hypothetical protein Q6359_06915, partial [Candidatus Brocadiales bacterium]|nr:hypothetical protein [Candidatus Brocadiales bacterium]
PQLLVKFEESAESGNGGVFPEVIGEWTLLASPSVYTGENGLYEYIDGAAEPYLSYSYRQVAVARYGDVHGREA